MRQLNKNGFNNHSSLLSHLIPYPTQPRGTDLGTLVVLFQKGKHKTRQTTQTRLPLLPLFRDIHVTGFPYENKDQGNFGQALILTSLVLFFKL